MILVRISNTFGTPDLCVRFSPKMVSLSLFIFLEICNKHCKSPAILTINALSKKLSKAAEEDSATVVVLRWSELMERRNCGIGECVELRSRKREGERENKEKGEKKQIRQKNMQNGRREIYICVKEERGE